VSRLDKVVNQPYVDIESRKSLVAWADDVRECLQ
jgi:hypothetical protein